MYMYVRNIINIYQIIISGRKSNKKYKGKKLLEIRNENYWMKESVTVSEA